MKTTSSKALLAGRIAAVGFGLVVMLALLVLLPPRPAHAATFSVDSTADTNTGACTAAANDCTLRGAINAANATASADTIDFDIPDNPNIPGLEMKTISPTSALPAITDNVTIDGYTQPGASENTLSVGNNAILRIHLNGTNAGAANGLVIQASDSIIKGLVINRFDGSGIVVSGSDATGNRIEGNFIGATAAGTGAPGNNGDGVNIFDATNNTVGGEASGARNVISGNGEDGIFVDSATGNKVLGNYIGTDRTGTADLGNSSDGVLIFDAQATTIGGATGGAGNVISGNQSNGILISGSGTVGNRVLGNFIGTTAAGNADLGNNFNGVNVSDAPHNRVGSTAGGAGNVISGNLSQGVLIAGSEATGNRVERNSIRNNATEGVILLSAAADNTIGGTTGATGNVIFNNGSDGVLVASGTGNRILSNQIFGNSGLGIHLAGGTEDPFGVTANDTDDPDTGPNALQNFPLITLARKSNSTGLTTIIGTLSSNPDQSYTIQCFLAAPDPSGHGEGQIPVAQTTATTNANGDGSFACVSLVPQTGQTITATATNTATGDTSEFSRNVAVVPVS